AWPLETLSPSRTLMLRTKPPSRCWIMTFCPAAATTPGAIVAPEIGAVAAQNPKPITKTATLAYPASVIRSVRVSMLRCHLYGMAMTSMAWLGTVIGQPLPRYEQVMGRAPPPRFGYAAGQVGRARPWSNR